MWSRKPSATLVAGLAELLVVAAGYRAGRMWDDADVLVPLSCFVGVTIAVFSLFHTQRPATQLGNKLSAVGLCVYVLVSEATEPFAFTSTTPKMLWAIAWLSPVVVGGLVLPRRGSWFAGVGYWLVLFGGVVALAVNVSHWLGGMLSFFGAWRA